MEDDEEIVEGEEVEYGVCKHPDGVNLGRNCPNSSFWKDLGLEFSQIVRKGS